MCVNSGLDFGFYLGYKFGTLIQKMSAPVSVTFAYDSNENKSTPRSLVWNGRLYAISKIGFHHTYREGRTLYHVFSVTTSTLFFRLLFNTESLVWRIEEIADGMVG